MRANCENVDDFDLQCLVRGPSWEYIFRECYCEASFGLQSFGGLTESDANLEK